ncbi:DNA-binding bromodomain-containing protein [Zea mays]|nr:DNA-binding bromodomain-containing protein [Zea mays]ONM57651.1 DNA-binding bromodomain-containing protein [Zea mays]ONM57653.1 DNA-binding bromodomain-containing protein [Zea mays]ONM57654.1 DNA-binding bromodomain-containing protein [Zea mays]ONM57656.1 DNA-binding bromodomain-containing protein [Zea mays]
MILEKLQKKDTYGVFAEPVDPEELPDYHDVIEHPMDFGTVRKKLARNAYRSFEQFEDDVFLICSNAMQYNAPDTIYFRQAHSIQELARKKFQELRDEGIPTENPIKIGQKIRPNFCTGALVKKPVLRYPDDDIDLSHKEKVKRPNSNNVDDDMSFKNQVKKTMSKNSQDRSCLLQKERIKKPIPRNSEDNLSSSFHKERPKKLISRHSKDDPDSPSGKEQVRKVISKNLENDESSPFHKHQVKKSTPQSSKDDFLSQKKHIKPIGRNGEDPGFSSRKKPIEDPVRTNVEDAGFSSTKRLSEKPISVNGEEDRDHCHQESSKEPSCGVEQDGQGYSCDEEAVKKPVCMDSHDAQGSDISAATIASVGDGSNGLSMSQPNATEPTGCPLTNGVIDKDISSPLDEIRSEKTDDILAKPSYKPIVVDETRRKTYDASEEQPLMKSDPVFDVFSAEPKELVNVGLDAEHSYAYVRSLARFAGSLGTQGWRIASDRIRQALPADVNYGRGWVGEYEPPLPSILVVNDQPRYPKSSETNRRRNAPLPRDNERFRSTETNNPKDMRRVATCNNVVGVAGPLESPEIKPRLFGVTTEPQHRSTDALSLHENHRVSGNVAKTKRTTNEQTRKGNSSSSARPLEMQLQKGASSGALDIPAPNKMAGQPRPFLQPPESTRAQQMKKIDSSKSKIPIEMAPQQVECAKDADSSVHDTPSSNGQPKHFFQSQAAASSGVHDMHSSNGQSKHYQSQAAASSGMHAMSSSNGHPKHYFKSQAAPSSGVHDMSSSNGQPKHFFQSQAVASGVHDMASNGQSKPLFQSQEATVLQPKNEATWVYHGRPGDGKVGTSKKSRPSTSIGFITKNQSINAAKFAMNLNGQSIVSDHTKSAGATAMPAQANIPNRGLDAPRNIFSAFPANVRENQSIPSAPVAQSWISFGAATENKPTIVSPAFVDNNCGWKMPFANVQPCDDTKLSVVPQFFRHPVQVVRENSVQNKGLVIFPQLVQPDFARSQGQPQWQGLFPHMQQKPGKDVLRPDLNIGFPSPGSPPARQSSGINLEAQQPDLALQL